MDEMKRTALFLIATVTGPDMTEPGGAMEAEQPSRLLFINVLGFDGVSNNRIER